MNNIFAIDLRNKNKVNEFQSIESIYFNSVFSENLTLTFRNQVNLNNSVKIDFVMNMPGDESIVETKLYF